MKLKRALMPIAVILLVLPAAPPSNAEPVARGPLVCIDPGDGGKNPGAIGNGLKEKVVNLDIALRLRSLVEAMGYRVVMTRTTDATVSLKERCRIANDAAADIFVSIHNNAAHTVTAEGTETFCYYDSEEGRRLATLIQNEVTGRIKLTNRGVKEAGFYVLKHTSMPAALLEGAFLTNPEEAKLLKTPEFRQKIAEGAAEGINKYFLDPERFDTYILLMNPDREKAAEIEFVFMRDDGKEETWPEVVPPGSRITVRVDDYIFNRDVSTLVRSTNGVPIVAERSVYFDFDGGKGGHGALGSLSPSREWHLAEGSTDWGFSTFVLVQNPSDDGNLVTVRFLRSDGYNLARSYTMEPHSRFTLDVTAVPGFERADFSVKVESGKPVVVERSMYWDDGKGSSGGHNSHGTATPGRVWHLAEGYTGDGFDTFILIANPNAGDNRATIDYMLPGGETLTRRHDLLPNSRKTIHLNRVAGLNDTDVSIRVSSELPVVVERSMYFDYFGIKGGSNSIATGSLSGTWHLAEGYTGMGFDTYILLMNPGGVDSEVVLRFLLPGGKEMEVATTVRARSRRTIKVNDIKGMQGMEFSTVVESRMPIAVERAMYFRFGSRNGGHSAIGAMAPAVEWYFAEGSTK